MFPSHDQRKQAKYPSLEDAQIQVIAPAIRELGGELKLGTQAEVVTQNLNMLRRANPGLGNYVLDTMGYVISPKARLVSGQLGGMLAPNVIYHAENFVTAPLIAAVTDPNYVGTVLAQQGRALTGATIEPTKLLKGQSPLQMGKVSVGQGIVTGKLLPNQR